MTTNDQQQPRERRGTENARNTGRGRKGRSAAVFISGVTLATAAAAAVGVRVAHHTPSGSAPIVTNTSLYEGASPTIALSPNTTSQVAQAPSSNRAHGTGVLDTAAAYSQRDDDESLGTTAGLATFESVYGLVEDHYVDQLPNDTKMSQGAVRSMLASLVDPNSFFLEPDQRALFDGESKGRFQGIGAITSIRGFKQPEGFTEYKIVIVDALPGSPAQKAGLKPGDVVTHIDDKWVLGSDPFLKANKLYEKLRDRDPSEEDAFRKEYESARKKALGGLGLLQSQMELQKGVGDKRTLTIQRPGVTEPIKVDLTTSEITIDPVSAKPAPDGKATIIKVALLTDDALSQAKDLVAKVPAGQGIVLDLRGNPGGTTSSSVATALQMKSLFSQGRSFAVEVGHNGKKIALVSASPAKEAVRPLVVLVDKGTARTAEALAASLQESGGATLLGGKTFGDAMSRTLYSLRDGSGFILTTGKLLSPKGNDWQLAGGLAPQVALASNLSEDQVLEKAESVLMRPQPVAANSTVPAAQP